MKKVKYLLPLLLLFITINVKAIDKCTTEEMNRLKELANKVQIKTDYELIKKGVSEEVDTTFVQYKVTVVGDVSSELKIAFSKNGDDLIYVENNELNEYTFYGGTKVIFKIFSYTTNLCTEELLKTEIINLPSYNTFYEDNEEKCKKYPEFKYCKEFIENDNKTNEEKEKEFSKYLEKDKIAENILNNNSIYYILGIILLIIIGIVFYLVFKKYKKNKNDL